MDPNLVSKTYDVYMRHRTDTLRDDSSEIVLDLADVPFIRRPDLRGSAVDKIKMSDDHSLLAFTVDVGNTEVLMGGIKHITDQKYLDVSLPRVGQIEFGGGENPKIAYYTESDPEYNRPCKVKRLCLETMQSTSIFVDDDPTHYVDIGVTKDKKYLIISSNTKEDSEIWVLPREGSEETALGEDAFTPTKIVQREKDVRVHIDHLRDFFVTITTDENKNYKLATLPDS